MEIMNVRNHILDLGCVISVIRVKQYIFLRVFREKETGDKDS
jgi:hypothetical protein